MNSFIASCHIGNDAKCEQSAIFTSRSTVPMHSRYAVIRTGDGNHLQNIISSALRGHYVHLWNVTSACSLLSPVMGLKGQIIIELAARLT